MQDSADGLELGQQRGEQERRLDVAAQRRRDDLLSLLALGYGFQVRLMGQVAATHAARLAAAHTARGGGEQAGSGPALVAAITGRLAPVAEEWLGIDPDQVVVSLHSGPGWGSAVTPAPGPRFAPFSLSIATRRTAGPVSMAGPPR